MPVPQSSYGTRYQLVLKVVVFSHGLRHLAWNSRTHMAGALAHRPPLEIAPPAPVPAPGRVPGNADEEYW